jgi:hypothetical protein
MTTDTRGTVSPAAAETADLALWTGRLAYADPSCTPALGPSQATRTPQALAPEPGDLPTVVAAVRQASQTMTRIVRRLKGIGGEAVAVGSAISVLVPLLLGQEAHSHASTASFVRFAAAEPNTGADMM